jgi:hypothetical protein
VYIPLVHSFPSVCNTSNSYFILAGYPAKLLFLPIIKLADEDGKFLLRQVLRVGGDRKKIK